MFFMLHLIKKYYADKPIFTNFSIISGGVFLSKLVGVAKLPLMFLILGRFNTDLLLSSDKLGQIISTFFIMGSLYSSVITTIHKINSASKINIFINQLLVYGLLIISAVEIVIFLNFKLIKDYFIDSKTLEQLDFVNSQLFDSSTLVLLVTPVILFVETVLSAFLASKNKFISSSLVGLISNLCIVAAILVSRSNFLIVSYGIFIGICISTICVYFEAYKNDFIFCTKIFSIPTDYLRLFLKRYIPKLFILDIITISLLIIVPYKQFDGQVLYFDQAITIVTSFGFIISSFITAIFPEMSKIVSKDIQNLPIYLTKIKSNFYKLLIVQFICTIALGLALSIFYNSLGKNTDKTYLINLLFFLSPSIVLISIKDFQTRLLYAFENNQVTYISIISNLAFIIGFTLLLPYKWDTGITISASLTLSLVISIALANIAIKKLTIIN
jgi:hypothetical protein